MRSQGWIRGVAAAVALLAAGARALEVDWSSRFALTGPDGKVNAATRWAGGWVLGGTFHSVAGLDTRNLARLDDSGQWSALDPANGLEGVVYALCPLSDGRLAVGGAFQQAGGQEARHLAIWDGISWEVVPGLGAWDYVYALAVDAQGALWVGGDFSSFRGQPATGVLRLVDGQRDPAIGTPFDNTGILDPTVWDFAVDLQGRVLASGWIDRVGGQPSAGVARWDGQSWDRLGAFSQGGGHCYSVEVDGDQVWVAGWFTQWNGIPAHGLARLTPAGWSAPTSPPAQGYSCLLAWDGEVWAGGAWNGDFVHFDGGQWSSTPVLDSGSGGVAALALGEDGSILAAGGFSALDGTPALHAAIRRDGQWGPTHDAGPALGLFGAVYYNNAAVDQLLPLGAAGHLAFGQYQGAAGGPLTPPALWTGAGWAAAPFEVEGQVSAAAVCATDLFVATGQLVRRWDRQTGLWSDLGDQLTGPEGTITTLAATPDGSRLYAGGYFWLERSGTILSQSLAVWERATNQWSPVGASGPEQGLQGEVSALLVAEDGSLWVGGLFTLVDGQPANGLARWAGGQWEVPAGAPGGHIRELASSGDLVWVAGGLDLAGQACGLARGSATGGWQLVPGAQGVRALLPVAGGLLASGGFVSQGGQPIQGLALWDGVDWRDTGATPMLAGGEGRISTLALDSDGTLLVGGAFQQVGGRPAHAFTTARIGLAPPAVEDLALRVSNGQLRFDWTPVAGAASYELRRLPGPWAAWESGEPVAWPAGPPLVLPLPSQEAGCYRMVARTGS